jgi:hypothetical protein
MFITVGIVTTVLKIHMPTLGFRHSRSPGQTNICSQKSTIKSKADNVIEENTDYCIYFDSFLKKNYLFKFVVYSIPTYISLKAIHCEFYFFSDLC